jgi:hypothetical protein
MEIPKLDAINLVKNWLNSHSTDEQTFALHDDIIDKNDYWVFFYNSKKFFETGDFSFALAGNSPLIVDKFEGKIYETGTAFPIEHYLKIFEKTELPRIKNRINK